MRPITLVELRQIVQSDKNRIISAAQSVGREPAIYLHWSAGHYGQFFADYHINIDHDGSLHTAVNNLAEKLA
jgi:hypothetical protein